jgi:hypothetical protein
MGPSAARMKEKKDSAKRTGTQKNNDVFLEVDLLLIQTC